MVRRWTKEERTAFDHFANTYTDGYWIHTSSMTGLNVGRSVSIIIELVRVLLICLYVYGIIMVFVNCQNTYCIFRPGACWPQASTHLVS